VNIELLRMKTQVLQSFINRLGRDENSPWVRLIAGRWKVTFGFVI